MILTMDYGLPMKPFLNDIIKFGGIFGLAISTILALSPLSMGKKIWFSGLTYIRYLYVLISYDTVVRDFESEAKTR